MTGYNVKGYLLRLGSGGSRGTLKSFFYNYLCTLYFKHIGHRLKYIVTAMSLDRI